MKTVTAVLGFEGTYYTFTREWDEYQTFDDGTPLYEDEDDFRHHVWWMWAEGNYACDCNRALFICRSCDDEMYPDFCEEGEPDLPCGRTIKLLDLKIEGVSYG